MKKLSLIAAMVLGGLVAASTLANAQDAHKDAKKGGQGGLNVEQRLERLTTQLSLTDDQKPKVKAVLEETSKKMQDPAADKKAIRDEQNTKMKAILTPEQFTKYQEMNQHRGKKGGDKKAEKKSE